MGWRSASAQGEPAVLQGGHPRDEVEVAAHVHDGEAWLVNANIPEYKQSGPFNNHEPKRHRKLLLHRRQINKLIGAVEREGMTLIPLKLYFNDRGRAKIEIALAKGGRRVLLSLTHDGEYAMAQAMLIADAADDQARP